MADYYDALAADYDWIFDDDALANGLAINHPATARLLERTPRTSLVLDAACGTGVNAAALARRGYRVWAADGSSAMAAVAAARFRSEQLEIPLAVSLWADLPAVVGERFDVVLCTGNSLVHAAGREAMIQALTGLREMVRPGGHVVVDSRNWEKLHAERAVSSCTPGRYRTAWTRSTSPISCSSSRTAAGSSRTSTGSAFIPSRSANCATGSRRRA
jgi:glycine/sarcosine N-methyltransferase